MFKEFDMLVENFDRAIMETITYKGQTLAQWESGEAEQDETAHESIRSEREARAAWYSAHPLGDCRSRWFSFID